MEGDDGFLAFVGFQEGEAEGGIHKSVFGKYAGGVSVLEDVEGGFLVVVSVGVVGAEFVAGEVLSGGFVQAGGQFVGEAVAVVGVGTPAGGIQPFPAVTGGIDVDTDHKCVVNWAANLTGNLIYTAGTLLQGDVFVGFYVGYTFDF